MQPTLLRLVRIQVVSRGIRALVQSCGLQPAAASLSAELGLET